MSRYVTKNHGIVIGSSNYFSFRTADEGMRTWAAIVWAQDYRFAQINSVNVRVKTPAQQLMWVREDDSGKCQISDYMIYWLNKNVGPRGFDWDARPQPESTHDCVFFRQRKGAVRFAKFICDMLSGIHIPKK